MKKEAKNLSSLLAHLTVDGDESHEDKEDGLGPQEGRHPPHVAPPAALLHDVLHAVLPS